MAEREFQWEQVSIHDQKAWLNREFCYVSVGAEQVAVGLGWLPEQTFDDLDYFQIVIARRNTKKIAFSRHLGCPGQGSDVYVTGGATLRDVEELLDIAVGLENVGIKFPDAREAD